MDEAPEGKAYRCDRCDSLNKYSGTARAKVLQKIGIEKLCPPCFREYTKLQTEFSAKILKWALAPKEELPEEVTNGPGQS